MKRWILVFTSLFAATTFAGQKLELPWTMSADSVQAILQDALRQSADGDKSLVKSHIEHIPGGFRLKDTQTKLTCMERSASPLAVQTYHCDIETNSITLDAKIDLQETMNAGSVQAVLNQILREYYEADQASPYPQGFVKATNEGWEVSDAQTKLVCGERSHPMLAVQMYRCLFN